MSHREHPFVAFRESAPAPCEEEALPVTTYWTGSQAKMLLSDGSQTNADNLVHGESGFVVATWASPKGSLVLDIPNARLIDGKIVAEEAPKPRIKKRPAAAIADGAPVMKKPSAAAIEDGAAEPEAMAGEEEAKTDAVEPEAMADEECEEGEEEEELVGDAPESPVFGVGEPRDAIEPAVEIKVRPGHELTMTLMVHCRGDVADKAQILQVTTAELRCDVCPRTVCNYIKEKLEVEPEILTATLPVRGAAWLQPLRARARDLRAQVFLDAKIL